MILLFLVWLNFILCWHLSISFFLSLLILLVSILRIWVISLLNTLTIILGDFAILFVYRRTCWFCRWFYIVFYLLWRRLIACFHYLILWVINLLPKRSLILILFRILFFVGLLSFEAFRMSRLNLSFRFLFFLRFLQTLYLTWRLDIGWLDTPLHLLESHQRARSHQLSPAQHDCQLVLLYPRFMGAGTWMIFVPLNK